VQTFFKLEQTTQKKEGTQYIELNYIR